jgi:hypothetical protein
VLKVLFKTREESGGKNAANAAAVQTQDPVYPVLIFRHIQRTFL